MSTDNKKAGGNPVKDFLHSRGIEDALFHDLADRGWSAIARFREEGEKLKADVLKKVDEFVEVAASRPHLVSFVYDRYVKEHVGHPATARAAQETLLVYASCFEEACQRIDDSGKYPDARGFKNMTFDIKSL
jgi:hypothetical protein